MNQPNKDKALEFLLTFSKSLSSTLDQGQLLDIIIESAKTLTQAEGTSLLLLDDVTQTLKFAHATGEVSEELKKLSVAMGQGIAGWVAREQKPQIVNQTDKDDRWYKGIDEKTKFTTRSLLCVPLLSGNKTIGVLEAINKMDGQNFDLDDQELLQQFAELAAQVLENADKYNRLKDENLQLRDELASRYTITGKSQAVEEVLGLARRVASGNTTVLLQGENGTGKELLARFIHYQSPRAEKPFIAVNSAAIPVELLESELFGHEKGAFTGAAGRRKGRFELAHGGTIFLDEVGDLPPAVQAKILRVLQEREFERLGGSETIKVDVRIIAATNRDLLQLVKGGLFREDLYYRLNVFQIFLPPLRQRAEDIPVLAQHFLEHFARETKKQVKGFSEDALNAMMHYSWPGNIRELQNAVERAVVMSTGHMVTMQHLPRLVDGAATKDGIPPTLTWDEAQDVFKREYMIKALEANGWNQRKTARILDIQPSYLSRLLRELDIKRPRNRGEF
jgi:Nif-specific regulatory protein